MTFEQMLSMAKETLKEATSFPAGLPAPQVTVLLSDKGHTYTAVNDVTGAVVDELKSKKDTKICSMLTVWKGDEVDLPSMLFRTALMQLDPENGEAEILLRGDTGYVVKKLKDRV